MLELHDHTHLFGVDTVAPSTALLLRWFCNLATPEDIDRVHDVQIILCKLVLAMVEQNHLPGGEDLGDQLPRLVGVERLSQRDYG